MIFHLSHQVSYPPSYGIAAMLTGNTKTDKRCWPKSARRQPLAIFYPRWCNSNAVNRELIHHHYHSENHSVAIRTNFTTLWVINLVAIRWSGFQKIICQIPLSKGGVAWHTKMYPFLEFKCSKKLHFSYGMASFIHAFVSSTIHMAVDKKGFIPLLCSCVTAMMLNSITTNLQFIFITSKLFWFNLYHPSSAVHMLIVSIIF